MLTNKHSMLAFATLIFFFVLTPSSKVFARDRIDSSERLQFLNDATGASTAAQSSSSSFEQRLNAVLDTTASPERTIVASEDAAVREKELTNQAQSEFEAARVKELNPERYDPLKNRDKTKITDSSTAAAAKEDGTEKGYQNARTEIQKEFDERINKKTPNKKGAFPVSAPDARDSAPSSALANNPFYVGDKEPDEANSFESRKAVIISRLVARGISQEDASKAVQSATSQEDLILSLMHDQLLSYGDASEATS